MASWSRKLEARRPNWLALGGVAGYPTPTTASGLRHGRPIRQVVDDAPDAGAT